MMGLRMIACRERDVQILNTFCSWGIYLCKWMYVAYIYFMIE